MLATKIFISQILALAIAVTPLHGDGGYIMTEVNPVSWIDKSETVYNDFITVNIEVDLYSPCSLELSNFSKTWWDFQWKMLCNMRYEAFMLPLTKICPRKEDDEEIFTQGGQNPKTINVNLSLLVGFWSVFGSTSISSEDISNMKLNISKGTEMNKIQLLKSSEIRKALDLMLGNIVGVTLVRSFDMKWDALTALTASDIFNKQKKSWKNERRIEAEFLGTIGIPDYKEAFGDVLLQPANSFNCFISSEGTKLKVSFSVPKANPNLKMFHAAPVVLLEEYKNYINRLLYNGTKNIVWSTNENCVYALYATDLNLEPLSGSDSEPKLPSSLKPTVAFHLRSFPIPTGHILHLVLLSGVRFMRSHSMLTADCHLLFYPALRTHLNFCRTL